MKQGWPEFQESRAFRPKKSVPWVPNIMADLQGHTPENALAHKFILGLVWESFGDSSIPRLSGSDERTGGSRHEGFSHKPSFL
jgi:hypothetical protein